MILANYRTALLGALPIFVIYYWDHGINLVEKKLRIGIAFLLVLVIASTFVILLPFFGDRFLDIAVVLNNIPTLLKADIYYTRDEMGLFSGRIYFWSKYLTEFFNAPVQVLFTGFGPDFWKNSFEKYAHNTYVSFLYEFGFAGLLSFLLILLKPVLQLIKVNTSSTRNRLLSCHIGFIVLNMATMPLWLIEGIILYGLLSGYTWFFLLKRKSIMKRNLND